MNSASILVVDDEKNVRDTFSVCFDEYNVTCASCGKDALKILAQPNDIDLVFLDIMMSGLSGLEVLREIKRKYPQYKVVLMTGYGSKDIVVEALRYNADEYIEKPFDVDKTKEIIDRLLRNGSSRVLRKKREGDSGTDEKIDEAREFIRKNFNRDLKLDDVAREIFLCPKYFSRLFKEKTGQGFDEFRISLRMESARDLLGNTRQNIDEIACKVGYQTPESFIKSFKRHFGVGPAKYRKGLKSRTG